MCLLKEINIFTELPTSSAQSASSWIDQEFNWADYLKLTGDKPANENLFKHVSYDLKDRFWPNYQRLFAKQLKFACQAKCFTVCSRPKILLFQHFLFSSSKKVFDHFQKHQATNFVIFACQAMFLDVARTRA